MTVRTFRIVTHVSPDPGGWDLQLETDGQVVEVVYYPDGNSAELDLAMERGREWEQQRGRYGTTSGP